MSQQITPNKPLPSVEHLLEELFALHRFGITPGLERTKALCAALGYPERAFPSIHVAGTNGKGTVSSVLASALTEAGYKVGLYTSPHVQRFNERMRVGGVCISDADLLRLAEGMIKQVRELGATFFEATTALAFAYFAEQKVDIAIVETGLGGRLDSTNVLRPDELLMSVITSIDLDHQAYLGDTLAAIASEKIGIIKPHTPVLVAEPRPSLRLAFMEASVEYQAPIAFLDDAYRVVVESFNADFSMNLTLTTPKQRDSERRPLPVPLHVPLCGDHQARNVLTAFAVLEQLQKRFPTSNEAVQRGLTNLKRNSGLAARIELLQAPSKQASSASAPPVVLDVAHNPAGMQALVQTLAQCGYAKTRWNVVFGAMEDKDISEMLATLAPITEQLYAPSLFVSRARTGENVAAEARRSGIQAEQFGTMADACNAVMAKSKPTLIVGSFYVADEALQWWNSRIAEGV